MKKKIEVIWESEKDDRQFDTFVNAEKWRDAFNDIYGEFHSWERHGIEEDITKKEVKRWFSEALFNNGLDFLDVEG